MILFLYTAFAYRVCVQNSSQGHRLRVGVCSFSCALAVTQQAEQAQSQAGEDGEAGIQEDHGALPSVQVRLAQNRVCEAHWIWVVWRLLPGHEGGATGCNQENEGRFVCCVDSVEIIAPKRGYQN